MKKEVIIQGNICLLYKWWKNFKWRAMIFEMFISLKDNLEELYHDMIKVTIIIRLTSSLSFID